MVIFQPTCRFTSIKSFLAFIILCLFSTQVFSANYPLEIIQPQANLDTKNRFYKAYPGLVYNVRVAVIGGEFPYRFELTSGPEGMSIDNKGEINWTNPAESTTPYNVNVKVLDAESNSTTVSWSILVTTSGFRFIDAMNGTSVAQGGDGTFLKPWKSLIDMYEGDVYDSKYTNSYAEEFIYWRAGSYAMDAFLEGNAETGNYRIPFTGNLKPTVWLAYPGEKPVLDLNRAYIAIYGGGSNTYIDGLDININQNPRGMGIQIGSSANNVTFRKNKFHGITTGFNGGNNSCIFISKNKVGVNWSIQDNEMFDVNTGYGVLGYNARKVLIEDNTLYQISGHPIGPKMGTGMWFIRANTLFDNPINSINVQYYQSADAMTGDIEISYNFVDVGGGGVRINSNQTDTGLPMYMFRNTFLDSVKQERITTTNGNFYWYDNVIINESLSTDKIDQFRVEEPSRLFITGNLSGSASDNIVDSNGFLQPSYSMFMGKKGHQIGQRPLPPTNLTVD